ncbi:hypothetical protein ACP70R_021409 [Stipagrostis hirtigluma subsp. patula]
MDCWWSGLRKAIDDNKHNYAREDVDRNESEVMNYISGHYKQALHRLPPSLAPFVDEAGVCLGFLDPVSNIIASAVAFKDWTEASQERRGKKRKRSKKQGKRTATSGDSDGEAAPRTERTIYSFYPEGSGSIESRSLLGLLAFLTTYFRHLPGREAMRYLRLAKADLLVAVRLIEQDRDADEFSIDGLAVRTALTCAVPSRRDLSAPFADVDTRPPRRFNSEPMRRAISRLPCITEKMLATYDPELALRKVLLDRIHGFYLEAISRFPTPCLRSRHHRGLLKGGHCYGPFDPVTNIVINTIWYDTVFPPHQEFEADMICDESLARTERRSLDGLVTFVKTLFPALSKYDTTRFLLFENARLDRVISRAVQDYPTSVPLSDAYKAAARAAHHPNSTALANLVTVILPGKEENLKSLIEAKRVLSPDDIQTISAILSQNDPPRDQSARIVEELTPRASQIVSAAKKEFEAHQSLIRKRVQAALKKHAREKREEYELHAICGVNVEIPKDDSSACFGDEDEYPHSHINILARLKGLQGSRVSDAAPTLLFIQCSNGSEDMEDIHFLCTPVSESSKDVGRWFHCERDGINIVHPSSATYFGQSFDFEVIARGEHSVNNEEIVRCWDHKTIFADTSEYDCLYFDPAWDSGSAARLNRDAKMEEYEGEDEDYLPQSVSDKIDDVLNKMVAIIG